MLVIFEIVVRSNGCGCWANSWATPYNSVHDLQLWSRYSRIYFTTLIWFLETIYASWAWTAALNKACFTDRVHFWLWDSTVKNFRGWQDHWVCFYIHEQSISTILIMLCASVFQVTANPQWSKRGQQCVNPKNVFFFCLMLPLLC